MRRRSTARCGLALALGWRVAHAGPEQGTAAPDAAVVTQANGALSSTTIVPDLDIGEFGAYIALAFYAGDLSTFGAFFDGVAVAVVIRRYDLDDDDGNGMNDVTMVDPPLDLPAGIIAAASPTCIPLTPEG